MKQRCAAETREGSSGVACARGAEGRAMLPPSLSPVPAPPAFPAVGEYAEPPGMSMALYSHECYAAAARDVFSSAVSAPSERLR